MLLNYKHQERSVLLALATEKGRVGLSDTVISRFQRVIDFEGKLKDGLVEQESAFVGDFVKRAKMLVENKTLAQ